VRRLRLITYLSPSIPAELFLLIGRDVGAEVVFEERISGPLEGDDEPFTTDRADIGFVCAPSYRWLRDSRPNAVELLPLPVPADPRCNGRPVYFSDVVVPRTSEAESLADLRGKRWAFNDRNSRSGWFSMVERVAPLSPEGYFGDLIDAGSHLRSIDLVAGGVADGAAIDSNVLRLHANDGVRMIESWGPFAIQPAIIRSAVDVATKRRIADAMLSMHERHGDAMSRLGFTHFVAADESLY
jgi:phosphonate transport system substrate-binding protein